MQGDEFGSLAEQVPTILKPIADELGTTVGGLKELVSEGKITSDSIIIGKTAVIKGDIFFKNTLKTEEGADIDGYIKRVNNGKANTEEDIAIEEIVERSESIKKPKPIHVVQQKKAV